MQTIVLLRLRELGPPFGCTSEFIFESIVRHRYNVVFISRIRNYDGYAHVPHRDCVCLSRKSGYEMFYLQHKAALQYSLQSFSGI
jgi:hypothetical protein